MSSHLLRTRTAAHLARRTFTTTRRTMSQKHEWMVILPDQAGALERRMAVRPDHIKNLKPGVQSGFWVLGGAMLDEAPKEGEGLKINGSIMLAVAATKEEVLEKLRQDVYVENEVWDFSKVQIFPFKSALRSAL